MKQLFIASAVLGLMQGCSVFTQPKANPVIEERVTDWGKTKVGILATTPERRVVIVKMPGSHFCAEPSADAADNVSAALSAVAQASVQGRVSDAQLGFAQSLATTAKQLFQRSQGVQLYRDGSFLLCNAYLNGAISKENFLARHERLLELVAPLIREELSHMHKVKPDEISLPILPKAELKFSTKQTVENMEETTSEKSAVIPPKDDKKSAPK